MHEQGDHAVNELSLPHAGTAPRLLAACLALAAGPALAAGFQINETSASGLGNAYAGGAAAAEDAATLWSNAAGISRVGAMQVVGAVHLITPSIKFRNGLSAPATQQPLGGDGGDAGGLNVVPTVYVVWPVNAQWTLGLGVNAPFGLVTDYDQGWIGRFQADKSDIKTINLNPTAAYKLTSSVALGVGLNLQTIDATFTNQANYSAALLSAAAANGIAPGSSTYNAIAAATPGLESGVEVRGDDRAFGWNVGVLWEIDKNRRFGAHYRSAIRYDVAGDVRFTHPTPSVAPGLAPTVALLVAGVNTTALYDSGVTAKVKLPPIANLSYFQSIDSRWDVMADAQWTGWSTIKDLTFVRSDGTTLQSTPENFKDTWKLALGVNYRVDGQWLLRGGLALDQSPVDQVDRTPRLPDNDRAWLTAGVQWRPQPRLLLDVGAAYVKVDKASINKSGDPPSVLAYGLLNGSYKSHTTIVSAQLAYSF
jgi:long-chain fatty acid transport protein